MRNGKTILALIPARSGSKGIPDKNMTPLGGISLLGRAVSLGAGIAWIDAVVVSTDSDRYACEAMRYGADVPALRPSRLGNDASRVLDVIVHEWQVAEKHWGRAFDVVVLLEPTSPLRRAEDVTGCVDLLLGTDADSVVTVSPIDTKHHPDKLLIVEGDRLHHYTKTGKTIAARQQLKQQFYNRNGLCYAFSRRCVMERKSLVTDNTRAFVVARPVANIDSPIDLLWAEFLLAREDHFIG